MKPLASPAEDVPHRCGVLPIQSQHGRWARFPPITFRRTLSRHPRTGEVGAEAALHPVHSQVHPIIATGVLELGLQPGDEVATSWEVRSQSVRSAATGVARVPRRGQPGCRAFA